MAYGLQTYDDKVRREDLLDLITDVSPDENPLSTMLGTTTATQTLHEWAEDYLARPTSVASSIEGAAATYSDLSQPGRRNNITQIISTTFRVSGTEKAVSVAGMSDPVAYQAGKNLTDWKNKLEFSLIRATVASGDSRVDRKSTRLNSSHSQTSH